MNEVEPTDSPPPVGEGGQDPGNLSGVGDPVAWLNDVDSTLIGCTTRGEVMAHMAEVLSSEFADWCALFVANDPSGDRLRLDYESAGRDGTLDNEIRRQLTHQLDDPESTPELANVFRTGRASLIDRLDSDSATGLGLRRPDGADLSDVRVHASLLVPIVSGGQTIGALHLLRANSSAPFTDYDREVMNQLADRIATKLSHLGDRDDDTELMIYYQKALLPTEIPPIEGLDTAVRYRAVGSGNQVGGDFYDVFPVGEDRWAFIIGDITGHGPAAAAFTALARHSIRMSAWHGDSPNETLDWLDHALKVEDDHSCTAAVNLLTRTDDGIFELTCALGGHPRPLVCRADGSVRPFGTWGTILGSLDEPRAFASATQLTSGDALVLYTDGITELPPPADLTEDRLCELVRKCWTGSPSAEELMQRIFTTLPDVPRDEASGDDVALVIARVI